MNSIAAIFVVFAILGAVISDDNNSIKQHMGVFNCTNPCSETVTHEHMNILDKNVCTITDDEWKEVKGYLVTCATEQTIICKNTGTNNYTKIDAITSKTQNQNYVASQCDEEMNNQACMEDKITAIISGFLKREGKCDGLLSMKEACSKEGLFTFPY